MNELPLLYVTSFNKRLYNATGRQLIQSFLQHKINNKLLITYEENAAEKIPKKDNFIFYNLENDIVLKEWLERFKYLIPAYYGGTAPDCSCHIVKERDNWDKHKLGCAHSEWNRRASQWFRKIVSLKEALKLNPERIVFLDSDVYFLRHVNLAIIKTTFDNKGLFYHLGKYRKKIGTGIESGVIGFAREHGGFRFLQAVIDCFLSGDFRQYIRWDDGYIFKMMLDKLGKTFPHRDLVVQHRNTSHVVQLGVLANFFCHNKGWHLRVHKIV